MPRGVKVLRSGVLPPKNVTQYVVQLMVIGDPGLAGLPAASHVAQEQDLALEAVAVLLLLVAELVALDQAQTQKTVTPNVVQ